MEENSADLLKIATRRRRAAAYLLDYIIFTFLSFTLFFVINGTEFPDPEDSESWVGISFFAFLPPVLLYFARDVFGGISPGKWIMGMKVVNDLPEAGKPSASNLVIRNMPLVIWPVEVILLLVSKDKKRWGDRLAKTKVVNDPLKADKFLRIGALSAVFMSFFIILFLTTSSVLRNSDAYDAAVIAISSDPSVIKEIGPVEELSSYPSGNIRVSNGAGHAQLQIKTYGKDKSLVVDIELEKPVSDSTWKVIAVKWE